MISIGWTTSTFAQDVKSHDMSKSTTTQPNRIKSDVYALESCPVSGQKLGSMGNAVVKMIDGREVRFCCAGCVGRFEDNKEKYFAEIDRKMIERQLPYYPIETCVVTGEPLVEDGEVIAVNHIYKNRLVRFCCKMCVEDFEKTPDRFLKKLDEAIIAKQREHYPLDACVISGQKLGAMGEPVEKVFNDRLIRFCCAGCIPKFQSDPAAAVLRLDNAWKERGHRSRASGPAHGDDTDRDQNDHQHNGSPGHGRSRGDDGGPSGHDHDG